MSQALYPPPRPLTVGEVIDSVFRIFQTSLVRCLPHGIFSIIAGQLPALYTLVSGQPPGIPQGFDPLWVLFYLVGTLIAMVLWSAVIFRQHAMARGQPLSTRGELGLALKRLPSLAAIMLLFIFIAGVAVALLQMMDPTNDLLPLLLVPGIPVFILVSLCWPVVLLTGRGPWAALKYSIRLLAGNFLRTLAVFVVTLAVFVVFYIVVGVIVSLVMSMAGTTDVPVIMAALAVALLALGAAATPFFCAVLLAVFGDLQIRKEGVDLERRIAGAPSD